MKIKPLYRKILRININRKNRKKLQNTDFSIISSNCIGGVIYHELGMKFRSPTINLYMKSKDFIKFCKNLEFYLQQTPEPINQNEEEYPVMRLYDINLYCVHYKNYEEVKECWKKRAQRVNMDNLFFIMN